MISYVPQYVVFDGRNYKQIECALFSEFRPVVVDMPELFREVAFFWHPAMPNPSQEDGVLEEYKKMVFPSENGEVLITGSKGDSGEVKRPSFDSNETSVEWKRRHEDNLRERDREEFKPVREKVRDGWKLMLEGSFADYKKDIYCVALREEGKSVSSDDANLWLYLDRTMKKIGERVRNRKYGFLLHVRERELFRNMYAKADVAVGKVLGDVYKSPRLITIVEEEGEKIRRVEPSELMREVKYIDGEQERSIQFKHLIRLENIFERGFRFELL